MYRHVNINKILNIKYYTKIPIDTFKRFSLPANDNLMRKGDLFRLTYMSIAEKGLLDPFLCYDIVNVNLDNPPIYKRRKIYGALILRGNIRWLVCKDLDIKTVNAVVATMDHGQNGKNLFTGTNFTYTEVCDLLTNEDVNSCYKNYNPNTQIKKNYLKMSIPSLSSVESYGVSNNQEIIDQYDSTVISSNIDYVKFQLSLCKV